MIMGRDSLPAPVAAAGLVSRISKAVRVTGTRFAILVARRQGDLQFCGGCLLQGSTNIDQ